MAERRKTSYISNIAKCLTSIQVLSSNNSWTPQILDLFFTLLVKNIIHECLLPLVINISLLLIPTGRRYIHHKQNCC